MSRDDSPSDDYRIVDQHRTNTPDAPLRSTMLRTLLAACLCLSAGVAHCQEIPGVRASLTAPRSLFAAGSKVELEFVLQVDADAEVPGDLLTGMDLEATVDDKPGPRLTEPGKGGTVHFAAGTRIVRTLSFPSERVVPNSDGGVAYVSVAWRGLAGVRCVFKIAPDAKNVDLATLDLGKTKVVLVTNHGDMTVSFRPDKAPNTVENFLKLCKSGFYDGTKFHRVVRNFMIQGGDPNSRDDGKPESWGQGDPGYKINAEFSDLKHLQGTLSMARSQDPNSAGSQFFIVHKDAAHLDNQYTAFGNLEAGIDVLNSIANTPCGGPQQSTPLKPVVLYGTILLPVKK